VLAAAAVAPAAAQGDAPDEPTLPAVRAPIPVPAAPPTITIEPAPTPSAIRNRTARAAPVVDRDWAPAPQAAPPLTVELKGKERKEFRKEKERNSGLCFYKGALGLQHPEDKVQACDWLLSQPPDPDAAWDYRAQLLQRRALLLTNAGAYGRAIEALDESDTIGDAASDPLFDLGIGLGNDLIRAFILEQQNQTEAAAAILDAVRTKRPYSPSIARAADQIGAGIGGNLRSFVGLLEARQRIDPSVNQSLLALHLMLGQLEPADRFGDQVSLVDPKMHGGWQLEGDDPFEALEESIQVAGTRAYVANAMGDKEKSSRLLTAAWQLVADYIGPDPSAGNNRPNKSVWEQYVRRRAYEPQLVAKITAWESIIALRANVEAGKTDGVDAALERFEKSTELLPAILELLGRQEEIHSGGVGGGGRSYVDQLRDSLLADEIGLKADRLIAILPQPEHLSTVPKFKSNEGSWLWGGTMGYTQAKEGDGEIRTVRFESLSASPAMIEEMLLLAIANFARTENKDGFIVLTSRTFSRVIHTTGWGGGYSNDAGYEAQARVQLIDTANPPPELVGSEARFFTVAEIDRELLPRYEAYAARQAAEKAAQKGSRR
jgi:hypothetical protein